MVDKVVFVVMDMEIAVNVIAVVTVVYGCCGCCDCCGGCCTLYFLRLL